MRTLLGLVAAVFLLGGAPAGSGGAPGEKRFQEGRAFLRQKPKFSLTDAATAFSDACEAGHQHGCVQLGLLLQDGRGVARNPAKAAELYERACDAGLGIGCFNLAGLHMTGIGVAEDRAKAQALLLRAEPLYRKACEAGDLQWCTNLGILYELPFLGEPDPAKAAAIYKKACDKKPGDWCVNYALQQANGEGMKRDVRAAAMLLDKACNAGVPLACGTLGQMYLNKDYGLSGKQDKATSLLKTACEAGEVQGCAVLSAVYHAGELVAMDKALGHRYGERACALGASQACFSEALAMLEEERPGDALGWFEKSCHIGNAEGCSAAATLLETGRGVEANAARASAYRSDACRLGDNGSCVALMKNGDKLPMSEEREKMFLEEACRRGIPGTCR